MIVNETNSAKMALQSLLLSFIRIESKFICSVHLHIFIYTFKAQNLSILRKYFQEFSMPIHGNHWRWLPFLGMYNINALKKALNKLKVKATPIAVRAWKLGEELEQSGKYDTKQKWISKIINDCSFWQDADHEIKLLIKSF